VGQLGIVRFLQHNILRLADTHTLQQNVPSLPLDIIDYIGKILIDDYLFGTVAALNVVSKDVRSCTLATLWRTVNLDARGGMKEFLEGDLWKRMIKSSGCRYTWYVSRQQCSDKR
jgi:hypothetical protein